MRRHLTDNLGLNVTEVKDRNYFREMGAQVTERIYPNAPHSVFADEIAFANAILSQ